MPFKISKQQNPGCYRKEQRSMRSAAHLVARVRLSRAQQSSTQEIRIARLIHGDDPPREPPQIRLHADRQERQNSALGVVEAAGVERSNALITRNLLILQTDKHDKIDEPPVSAYNLHTKCRQRFLTQQSSLYDWPKHPYKESCALMPFTVSFPWAGSRRNRRCWIRPHYAFFLPCQSPESRLSRQVPGWPETPPPSQVECGRPGCGSR